MTNSPEGNSEGGDSEEGDLPWLYGNPEDDLFDEKGNLKLGPYGYEDLLGDQEPEERHPGAWYAEAPPEDEIGPDANPLHPEA